MSGGPTSCQLLSSSNVFFASQTRVNQSNISSKSIFRLGVPSGGMCVTFIIHELCGLRIGNCESFHWIPFWWKIFQDLCEKSKIQHLLRGVTFYTIRIELDDKDFNQDQWHDSKVKYLIWVDLINMYTKVTWKRLAKYMKISMFSTKAFLEGVSQMWDARGVHCKRDNWNPLEIGNNILCR